jgi:peptidoglycan hydrolase CwlO-like protein
MKQKTILSLLIVFVLSSTAVFADENENAIITIIKKNPLVAKYVQELQNTITSLTEKNSNLEETVKTQQEKIEQPNQTINDQTQTINTQQKTIANLSTKNEELNSAIQYVDLSVGFAEGPLLVILKVC